MTTKDDGGPAVPSEAERKDGPAYWRPDCAECLLLNATMQGPSIFWPDDTDVDQDAEAIADAMLAARQGGAA